jgi:type I restriction enzyme S subunit
MAEDGQAKYQPYPAYKPSGVMWLGDIPEEWKASKLKYETKFQVGWTPPTKTDENFVGANKWANISDLGTKTIKDTVKRISDLAAAKASMSITPSGSLLYSFKLSVGLVSFAGEDMYTNEAIASFLPSGEIPLSYLYYALPIFVIQNASTNIYGARILNQELIRGADIAVPPFDAAAKIAAFLDYETAKIDALIVKQQRLIALLEEKRQAVISHAVTKGLDPTAPLRPSGIDWLGDVPAHWEVKHGKHLFEFVTSGSRGWAEYYSDEGALFFRITNLTRDTIRPKLKSLQYVTPPRGSEGERSKISLGDLLISITADLGSVCVADENLEGGYVSQHVALCRPNGEVFSTDWFGYAILSDASKFQLLESGYGGTKMQLSLPDLRELVLAKPPKCEQVEIANFLDDKLKRFTEILDQAVQQITLLKERRTALISAAVTGKIDLRDWQQPGEASDISAQEFDQAEALA